MLQGNRIYKAAQFVECGLLVCDLLRRTGTSISHEFDIREKMNNSNVNATSFPGSFI